MLLTCENIIKILPIIRLELYNKENNFLIPTNLLHEIITIFKNHYIYHLTLIQEEYLLIFFQSACIPIQQN